MNTPPHYGTVQIDGVPRPALIFPLTLDGIRRKNLGLAIWFVPLVALAVIYLTVVWTLSALIRLLEARLALPEARRVRLRRQIRPGEAV